MSHEADKFNHSKRLQKNENAVNKQVKIAKEHGVPIKDPHRLEKHHAMDCGNPKCMLCSNPRRTWHELTAQEKRMFQETEILRMRHSNGTVPEDDNE
jgi:hypothetical protein